MSPGVVPRHTPKAGSQVRRSCYFTSPWCHGHTHQLPSHTSPTQSPTLHLPASAPSRAMMRVDCLREKRNGRCWLCWHNEHRRCDLRGWRVLTQMPSASEVAPWMSCKAKRDSTRSSTATIGFPLEVTVRPFVSVCHEYSSTSSLFPRSHLITRMRLGRMGWHMTLEMAKCLQQCCSHPVVSIT